MQQPMKACIHVVTDFVRVLSLAGIVEQAAEQREHNACVHVLSDLLSYTVHVRSCRFLYLVS